ncbi:MAG: hypothetical protein FWF45_06900 [Coriobacteriia bacterium]|nr:hypothetical protein [Coriobacteriia bacterium]
MGMTKQYVEQLSESIGPRPVASDTERDGAEWIRTQFVEHGLNTTVQNFDTIRSLSGAYLLYALVPIIAVVLMGVTHKWAALSWLLWVVLLAIAILAWLDFSGRGSLSKAFPKGPSQNVIGRYAPIARPGEELTKIVLVAHYDTDRSSPLTSEGLAVVGRLIKKIAHAIIMLLPVLALIMTLPLIKPLAKHLKFLTKLYPWNWYVLLILSIPVLLMLLDLLIAQIMRRYSSGANNNASGVAALLSICEDLAETINPVSPAAAASESTSKFGTGTLGIVSPTSSSHQPVTQPVDFSGSGSDFDTTFDFGVRKSSSSDSGGSSGSSGSGSSSPSSSSGIPSGYEQGAYGRYEDYDAHDTFVDTGAAPPVTSADFDFGTDEEDDGSSGGPADNLGSGVLGADVIGGALPTDSQFTDSFGAVSPAREPAPNDEVSEDAFAAFAAGVGSGTITRSSEKKKGGLFGKRKKQIDTQAGNFGDSNQPSDWLGVDTGYDAREEGRKIGSWDNFPDDNDDFDDGLSWKGGAAEGDLIEDDGYAATQAARIRRKYSETLSTSAGFGNKELWFVATSAHYVHSCGMRTFLEDYHEDLRGALVINLVALGAGELYWSVNEQAGKVYKSSARLTALTRRVAREKDLHAKPYKKGALRTEAGWALADGRKAMSLIRLSSEGIPCAEASTQDVVSRLQVEKIDEAVELVISLIQNL